MQQTIYDYFFIQAITKHIYMNIRYNFNKIFHNNTFICI